ncbi:MAG: efflux RND transporter permease subunit [Deltaproteobacteria bacterium]|nr:efflux RND transporter permease subunit [Deltaproteobacteria bacterium]
MFLSNAAIRRPIAMGCLIIALTLLGFNAYRTMGLEVMPKVDVPFITITTLYPGASPEEIETDVAKRIEDRMVAIDGLKHVSSSCMENVCLTMLEFNLAVDVDIAATDVREKLDLVKSDFPDGVEDPQILKYDINAKAIVQLALTGEVSVDELYDYADNTLKDRITVLSGVANVDLIGGAEREVQVLLDRNRLAARGLTSADIVQAVERGIRTIPSGRVRAGEREYAVKFDAEYDTIPAIGQLEVMNNSGQRCYLRDVGRVEMAMKELRQTSFIDGRPCIAIKVIKKADANAVRVVDRVRAAMADLQRALPGGMELVWVTDDGIFTRSMVNSAWINIAEGIVLTALILFLFLYNLRALLVVSITMPLTVIIGLFFMHLAGYTLNAPTLLAIGMSVGILVTNSIVVLEAIVKRLEETGDPKAASRLGAKEAFIAVLASAGTNCVVLFPLTTMDTLFGRFIASFALTMVILTVVSLFISFTLTPLLCSILLRRQNADSDTPLIRMERWWNRGFDRVIRGYRAVLCFNERHRWMAVLFIFVALLALVHALLLAPKLGSTTASEPDKGEVNMKIEFPTHYNLGQTVRRTKEMERRLADLPDIRHTLTMVGKVESVFGQSSEGVYMAQVLLRFTERTQREETIYDLMTAIRSRLADLPDAIVSVGMPALIGGQSSAIEMEIAGKDLALLDDLALQVLAFTQEIDGIEDPDTTVRTGKPEIRIRPNRAVLADLGIPATGIGLALRSNLEGITAGTFKKGDRSFDITVKLAEEKGKEQVPAFLFPGVEGRPITLESLGDIEETRAPVQITRKDKQRVSKLFANLDEGTPLGAAVSGISHAIDTSGSMPMGYGYSFTGQYESMVEAQQGLAEAGIIAFILVILTLAAILESFKQPVLILVTIPLALIGMIWSLALGGKTLEMFVLMGGVMLIGIVVNNAILIMDRFNTHVIEEGVPRHEAMISAACERFRPVAMITLAAVLGMLPLAFGRGIGAEIRNACGLASAGGIFISGILTVFVMPALYNLFTRRDGKQK